MLQKSKTYYYILVIGTLMNITAYVGILNLQSSINIEENLGTISASVMYLVAVFICIFVAPLLLLRAGAKWSLVVGETGFIAYSIANFYPRFYTLIPGAIIGSLGEALVWAASPLYLSHLFREFWTSQTEESNEPMDNVKNKWFGQFYSVLKSGQIWGNLLSYAILYGGRNLNVHNVTSDAVLYANMSSCGAQFCSKAENTATVEKYVPASKVSIYLIFTFYLCLQFISVLMHSFGLPSVDSLNKGSCNFSSMRAIIWNTLKDTFYQIFYWKQILLTPSYFYYGYLISYSFTEFTKAFVSCTIGVQHVGLAMALYGLANVLAALVGAWISHRFGLAPLLCFICLFDLGNYVAQILWLPTMESRYVVYVFGAMLGTSDGIWQFTNIANAALFFRENEELAFGTVQLWCVLGMFTGFLLSGVVCVSTRIYSMIGILVLAGTGYCIAEIFRRNHSSSSHSEIETILNHNSVSIIK
ncbi:protein unc-93 homolog A-like isoform X1 [Clavelina lepadiformis]|uniref:protein unc-93 homolog A-like isoform X1 n=1 Tax=Clavelina lepadiformis TaxID=159417 RepID=UPI004043086F